MKTPLRFSPRLMLLGLLHICPLQAAVIAADDFNSYAAGTISGKNGGTGTGTWTGAWSGQTGAVVTTTGFSGFGNALVSDDFNSSAVVSRNYTAQSQTFYIGFTFVSNANDSGDFIQFGSGASGNLTATNQSVIWRPISTGGKFEVRSGASSTVLGPVNKSANTVYQVVLKLGYNGTTLTYDNASVFIDKSTETGADVSINVDSGVATMGYFGIRTSSLDPGDTFMIDNLKIATTYAEAFTAVPEPGAVGLIAFGAIFTTVRRRRTSAE